MLKRPEVGEHLLSSMENCVNTHELDCLKHHLGVAEEEIEGNVGRLVLYVSSANYTPRDKKVSKVKSILDGILTVAKSEPKAFKLMLLDLIFQDKKVFSALKNDNINVMDIERELDYAPLTKRSILSVKLGAHNAILKCTESIPTLIGRGDRVVTQTQYEISQYNLIRKNSKVQELYVPCYAYGRLWIKDKEFACVSYEIILLRRMCLYDLYLATLQNSTDSLKTYGWLSGAMTLIEKLHEQEFVHGDSRQPNITWHEKEIGNGNLKFIDPERSCDISSLDTFTANLRKLIDINLLLLTSVQLSNKIGGAFDIRLIGDFSNRLNYICDRIGDRGGDGRFFLFKIILWHFDFFKEIHDGARFFEKIRSGYPNRVFYISNIDFSVVYRELKDPVKLQRTIDYLAMVYKYMITSKTNISQVEYGIPSYGNIGGGPVRYPVDRPPNVPSKPPVNELPPLPPPRRQPLNPVNEASQEPDDDEKLPVPIDLPPPGKKREEGAPKKPLVSPEEMKKLLSPSTKQIVRAQDGTYLYYQDGKYTVVPEPAQSDMKRMYEMKNQQQQQNIVHQYQHPPQIPVVSPGFTSGPSQQHQTQVNYDRQQVVWGQPQHQPQQQVVWGQPQPQPQHPVVWGQPHPQPQPQMVQQVPGYAPPQFAFAPGYLLPPGYRQ